MKSKTRDVNAYSRWWYKNNKTKMLHYRLKGKFGISIDDFNKMLAAQDGVCAICREKNFLDRRLAVDHDHATSIVRGLLCTGCNGMLGLSKDRPGVLRAAAEYLERGRG